MNILSILLTSLFPILIQISHSVQLFTEPLPPSNLPFWSAIERLRDREGDAILLRPEFCSRSCSALLGEGAEQIHRARCVCRCPAKDPVFLQKIGKCGKKMPDCPGRLIHFEHPENPGPLFVPTISLPRNGEPLAGELRIAWKESGVKIRQSQGPRCKIQAANFLGNTSVWQGLNAQKLFEPGWADGNGQVMWKGDDLDVQNLAGGIVHIELECVAGKSNATFCLFFAIEGQLEFRAPTVVSKTSPLPPPQSADEDATGMELERGRRAEVVVIILLAILLFLSLLGSLFLWNICWRVHKRKLVHSLQMQFLHYARQEKEKAISECQLRYQALVKAAAGMRNAEGGPTTHPGQSPYFPDQLANGCGGGTIEDDELIMNENGMMMMMMAQRQPPATTTNNMNGRRKLYFSSAAAATMTPSPAMITGNTASTAATADAPLMPLMAVYMRRCAQRKENEFFEPQLMSNPPPMASEFLSDLRKMISVARERIRTRRHVPRLAPVVESEDEGRATPAVNNTTTDGGAGGGILAKVTTKSIGEMKKEEKKVNENEENNLKIAKANGVDVEDKENSNSILTSMEEIVQEQQKRRRGSKGEEDEEKQKEESKVQREEAGEMMEEKAIEMDEETTATQSSLLDSGNANNNHKEEEENIANDVPTENMPNGRNEETGENTVGGEAKSDESRDSDQLPDQMPLHVTNATASPSSTPIQQQSTTNPSRIPVGTVANGKSPRMQFKFSALCRRAPPLPPRPPPTISNDNGRMNEVNAQQSWQKKPGGGQNPLAAAKRRITTTTANNNASSGTEMEEGAIFKQPLAALSASTATGIPIGGFAVAVCPPPSFACGDRMKKSLPRRKKAIAPQPISMPPNTAVLPKTAAPTAV